MVSGAVLDRLVRPFLGVRTASADPRPGTVLVYAAVAPLFMHWSMPETPETEPGTEPVSAHAHIQTCFFQVLILTTALFLDALFFAVIWTPYFLL